MKSKTRRAERQPKVARSARQDASPPPAPRLHAVQVWDLPTRLSHGAMVVLLLMQILSGQFAVLSSNLHLWAGYALLVIVLFRIAWGLAGSESARFSVMLASLRGLPAYLPLLFSSRPTRWPGHNPLGSLSSLVLLGLLLLSCLSGLFIESWGEYRGPLAERVSRGTGIFMADLHGLLRWPLYLLVCVHILAALAYLLIKRENRIAAIFTDGRIELAQPTSLSLASTRRAWILLLFCVLSVGAIVTLGPID